MAERSLCEFRPSLGEGGASAEVPMAPSPEKSSLFQFRPLDHDYLLWLTNECQPKAKGYMGEFWPPALFLSPQDTAQVVGALLAEAYDDATAACCPKCSEVEWVYAELGGKETWNLCLACGWAELWANGMIVNERQVFRRV